MEVYPPEYINHDCPFVMVSGLGEHASEAESIPQWPFEQGIKVDSPLPPVELPEGKRLLSYLTDSGFYGIWPPRTEKPAKGTVVPLFRVKAVGRAVHFPPRKAKPPPGFTQHAEDQSAPRTLHSQISPLSPSSPIFPDGVMTHWWLRKHSDYIPCAFISFYEIATRSRNTNELTAHDNRVISSINNIKKVMTTSSTFNSNSTPNEPSTRRTKLVVVLLSELSNAECPGLDDRISHIRRMTNMDPKSNFFVVPAHSTSAELNEFARYLEVSLLPSALEYYRELSKHARKKKAKGTVPLPTVAPTTTSQVLSSAGWGIRYELKLGVFAETRQEMDIASKHYDAAYDGVFNEILQTTSEWSERWKDARLLTDMLAFRIARCALWMGNWAYAVRKWEKHVEATKDVLERRGKGIETFGYSAWLSNWYRLFAELVKAANIPLFETAVPTTSTGLLPAAPTIYAAFEPSIPPKEKIYPHYRLHHPGFYYIKAAQYMRQRQLRSSSTDDSDAQDTYLCGDIHSERKLNHAEKEIDLLRSAVFEFESRQQIRMANSIRLTITELLMKQAELSNDVELWKECSRSLGIVARKYRKDRWIGQLDNALQRRLKCAQMSKDASVVLATELELLDSRFSYDGQDLSSCLEGYKERSEKTALVLRGEDFVNFLDTTFTFAGPETHVGEYSCSQLAITSQANASSKPVTFSELKIAFEGNIRTIVIKHSDTGGSNETASDNNVLVTLKGEVTDHHSPNTTPSSPSAPRNVHSVTANLTLRPGQTKIFELYTMLREAGDAKANCVTVCIENEDFDLEVLHELEYEVYPFSEELGMGNIVGNGSRRSGKTGREVTLDGGNGAWYEAKDGKIVKRPIRQMEPGAIKILPKPPKMEITVENLNIPAFVDELLTVAFSVQNEEDEPAETSIHVKIQCYENDVPIEWYDAPEGSNLSLFPLGQLAEGSKKSGSFSFTTLAEPADCILEITAHYRLLSDPETPVSKTVTIDLPVINPFVTAYSFSPKVHEEKWPSYFSMEIPSEQEEGPRRAEGLKQRWCLTATLTNQTSESLSIVGHQLPVAAIHGESTVTVISGEVGEEEIEIPIAAPVTLPFILDMQKRSFDDRRPSTVGVAMAVYWKRPTSRRTNKTTLPVPELPIPASEPRLLATVERSSKAPHPLNLTYTLENPTIYFLTFSITMEGSDSFAFGGPKQIVIQLLPYSRHSFKYSLLPLHPDPAGEWIKPVVKVMDRYFGKVLRCSPADDPGKMKLAPGGDGILLWTGDGPGMMAPKD